LGVRPQQRLVIMDRRARPQPADHADAPALFSAHAACSISIRRRKVTALRRAVCNDTMRENRSRGTIIATHEKLSFCRICMGHCAMVLTVDEDDQLVDIRADR